MREHKVLNEYDIGTVSMVTGAGGTAGSTWKITTSCGEYLMRLRGSRTSSDERLRFDHGLRNHLAARGVPTVSAVRTKKGNRWVRRHRRVYELYPFVAGRQFNPDNKPEIVHAAWALAEFHKAAADYRPPSPRKEVIAQFTALDFSDETSDRLDDPRLQKVNMLALKKHVKKTHEIRIIDWCIARTEQLLHTYAGAAYESLTGWIIHGDYTPTNLLFSKEGEVVGIFDLDWSLPGSRCRDVADGLYFFASKPRLIDSSDIWSLTDTVDFDLKRCTDFLRAYQSVAPLSSHEIEAVPSAFAARWFSIRLEGMAKVNRDERFTFFSREVEKPLFWLDANWTSLASQITSIVS